MKKTAFTAFIAFWTSVLTILTLHLLLPVAIAAKAETTYTLEQVAEHDQVDNCWMVIHGNVYDFSSYIPSHPTPPDVMTPWCGKEATEGMKTKGYGRDHSSAAWEMMAPYLIGTLIEE